MYCAPCSCAWLEADGAGTATAPAATLRARSRVQVFNLRAMLEGLDDQKRRNLMILVLGGCQLTLAVLMKLYLFAYKTAPV